MSLPSRECGLKLGKSLELLSTAESLPSRECGLKFHVRDPPFLFCIVTPFVGVWIEMLYHSSNSLESLSLPSRECGLKSKGI